MPIHKVHKALGNNSYGRHKASVARAAEAAKKQVKEDFEEYLKESMDAERLLQQRK